MEAGEEKRDTRSPRGTSGRVQEPHERIRTTPSGPGALIPVSNVQKEDVAQAPAPYYALGDDLDSLYPSPLSVPPSFCLSPHTHTMTSVASGQSSQKTAGVCTLDFGKWDLVISRPVYRSLFLNQKSLA